MVPILGAASGVSKGFRTGKPGSALRSVLPRVQALAAPDRAVLSRSDPGFDSARWRFQQDDKKRGWSAERRTFEYLVKWNPRRQDLATLAARAEGAGAFEETRPGKRVARLDLTVERAWQKENRDFRLVVRLNERTFDRHDQDLLVLALTPGRLVDPPPGTAAGGHRSLRQARDP